MWLQSSIGELLCLKLVFLEIQNVTICFCKSSHMYVCANTYTTGKGAKKRATQEQFALGSRIHVPINILNCVIHGSSSVSSFASCPQVPIGSPDYIDGTVGPLPTQQGLPIIEQGQGGQSRFIERSHVLQ